VKKPLKSTGVKKKFKAGGEMIFKENIHPCVSLIFSEIPSTYFLKFILRKGLLFHFEEYLHISLQIISAPKF